MSDEPTEAQLIEAAIDPRHGEPKRSPFVFGALPPQPMPQPRKHIILKNVSIGGVVHDSIGPLSPEAFDKLLATEGEYLRNLPKEPSVHIKRLE